MCVACCATAIINGSALCCAWLFGAAVCHVLGATWLDMAGHGRLLDDWLAAVYQFQYIYSVFIFWYC